MRWISVQTAEGRIVVGFSQPRAQNVIAAEDVQRQIAIVVVVAVKEAPFLFAVQRQVGGVHVQHDLSGRLLVRLDEHLHQQFIHRLFPERDLLVPVC